MTVYFSIVDISKQKNEWVY